MISVGKKNPDRYKSIRDIPFLSTEIMNWYAAVLAVVSLMLRQVF